MRKLSMVAVLLVIGVGQAGAQSPITFAVEGRGAFAVPTGEWTDEDAIGNGYGFGANVQVGLGAFGVYGGWESFIFGLDEEGLDGDASASAHDTGFRAGVTLSLPTGGTSLAPFANGGIIYNQLTTKLGDDAGSLEFESDNALGWEAGVGVVVPLGPTMAFTPAARYRTHKAEFDGFAEIGDSETTVGYFVVDLGLRFGLGR